MQELIQMGARQARDSLQQANNELIDIVQGIRNEFTGGERMNEAIEKRLTDAFDELQSGRAWVQALTRI